MKTMKKEIKAYLKNFEYHAENEIDFFRRVLAFNDGVKLCSTEKAYETTKEILNEILIEMGKDTI